MHPTTVLTSRAYIYIYIFNHSSYERRLIYQEIGGLKNVAVSLVYSDKDLEAEKKRMRVELAFAGRSVSGKCLGSDLGLG